MVDISEAAREIMWNVSSFFAFYLLFFAALIIFSYGAYSRICFWKKGKSDKERFLNLPKRFYILIKTIFLQKKVAASIYPGIYHGFFFYSFGILAITTIAIFLDYDFNLLSFKGRLYALLSFLSEMAGILILAAIAMALWRRLIIKPETLDTKYGDILWLVFWAFLIFSGFLVEGLRIASIGDKWPYLSFGGYFFSLLFTGFTSCTAARLHSIFWWFHAVLAFAWIAAIPYTRFFHILTLPANAFFMKLKPRGALSKTDILELIESENFNEEEFTIGIGNIEDLTWKQKIDLDACVSCGRCENVCPAFLSGQALSPKKFISSIKNLATRTVQFHKDKTGKGVDFIEIVNNAFDENFIWLCRTCMACVEACPAFIEHVDALLEIRRNETAIKGRLPVQASKTLKNIESLGNPFASQDERGKCIEELGVPVVAPGEAVEVLYWIGCFNSFDPIKRKIAVDLCNLLKKIEINFGILGFDEHCCGDPARVLGEEYLFQTIAKKQISELNLRNFNMLLVSCPHGYTVLKDEYPRFGGKYKVVHYTELLDDIIRNKGLQLRAGDKRAITYHDPCFLGRYQNVYDAPRNLINAIPNVRFIEMKNHKENSFCCGGGGGHFWMDLKDGERINHLRVKQAADVGADTIVTACPFCLHMLDDAVKSLNLEGKIEVLDIIWLLQDFLSI